MARNDIPEIVPDVPEGLDIGLRNYWYPILQTEELPAGEPVAVAVLGENLAAWRGADGRPKVVVDGCPHRNAKLSVGRVLEGDIQCLFHGLRFDGAGRCTLIPWLDDDSALRAELSLRAYPAEELGGYVWAYLGDADRFPPPPLSHEAPEELTKPDEFVWFRVPTEVWDANWLLALDGQDAYHVSTLHAGSQAVPGGGGAAVPLEDRRIKIVEASYGIRAISTDRAGNALDQGHFTEGLKGKRFALPCLSTNPIRAIAGRDPYTVRVWQMPIDGQRTLIARYLCWRATDAAGRDSAERDFHAFARPRGMKVSAEDAVMAAAQGSLVEARANEYLFREDMETVRLRRRLKEAFLAQAGGKRIAVPEADLAYPLQGPDS